MGMRDKYKAAKKKKRVKTVKETIKLEKKPSPGRKIRKRKIRKQKIYPKQKCAFMDKEGTACSRNAVGQSTLCRKHGGTVAVIENTLDRIGTKYHVATTKSLFLPEKHPIAYIDFSRGGKSDIEIAAEFQVGVQTLRGWAEKYEMFATAYDIGQALHEAWWREKGKDNLTTRGFNTTLFKFLTGNILGYSDKMEQKNFNMNVHGVLKVPGKLTADEWEAENSNANGMKVVNDV